MRVEKMIKGMYGGIKEEEYKRMWEYTRLLKDTKELKIPYRINTRVIDQERRTAYTLQEDMFRVKYINEIGYIKLEKAWVEPLSDYLRGKVTVVYNI